MMRLSISNIAWSADKDMYIYGIMPKYGFSSLEIAPTRIFSENPYDRLTEAKAWSRSLYESFGLQISSMQSIWYGRQEKLFGSNGERKVLSDYTKKAIDFAAVIGCRNLVFGCPRNRNMPDGADPDSAVFFFKELGDYAFSEGVTIGIEPNPPIYNTNYINTTEEALTLIRKVNSKGFLLNLDVGTMIENNESTAQLTDKVHYISHVHISEPGLGTVQYRKMHRNLLQRLFNEAYSGAVSIEMGKTENISAIENIMQYLSETAKGY